MLPKIFSGIIAASVVSTCVARAQEDTTVLPWKKVGNWELRIDKTVDFGCFMTASFTRGTAFRIGIDQKNLNGYVLFGNTAWKSLEVGKTYEVAFQFDTESPWKGIASGH